MKVVGSKGRCLGSASRHAYAMESVANVVPRRLVAPDVTASSGRKAAGEKLGPGVSVLRTCSDT
jgi:hypothetical protein